MNPDMFIPTLDWDNVLVPSLGWIALWWTIMAVGTLVVLVLIANFTKWGRQFWRITGGYFTGRDSLKVWAWLAVLLLSVVIGYYVIGKVHHALHTPLMSVTNAISGIIVVGALLQVADGSAAVRILSAVAILLASINVFGGFAVTRRMLAMFSRS